MAALSKIHPPELVFKKLIALDLFLMIMKMWKNFVSRSEHVSQISMDLDFQRVSSLRRSSSRVIFRLDSKEKELG
jgi:hypothetical protein